jgi:hypothetical protein
VRAAKRTVDLSDNGFTQIFLLSTKRFTRGEAIGGFFAPVAHRAAKSRHNRVSGRSELDFARLSSIFELEGPQDRTWKPAGRCTTTAGTLTSVADPSLNAWHIRC